MGKILRLNESELTKLIRTIVVETSVGLFARRRSDDILKVMNSTLKYIDRADPRHDHLRLNPEYCDKGYEKLKQRFLNIVKSEFDEMIVGDDEEKFLINLDNKHEVQTWITAMNEIFENAFEEKLKKFYNFNCRKFKD